MSSEETLNAAKRYVVDSGLVAHTVSNLRVLVIENPKVLEAMKDQENMDSLIESASAMYADLFTAEELEEMLVFQSTPVGQKLMKTSAKLAAGSLEVAREWLLDLMDRVEAKEKESKEKIDEDDGDVP